MGVAERRHELGVDVVDLDRRESEPLHALDRTRFPDQPREAVPGGAVAEAAQVDTGEDELAVALGDAPPDLGEDGLGAAAARCAAHERNHAEVAAERAAVLDLDEGAHAVEARVGADATDRADVSRHLLDGVLDLPAHHRDVCRQSGERRRGQPGAAARDENALVRPRGPRGRLARLRERLVRDAARVDDGDVAAGLRVTVAQQPLAQRLRVGLGDLAPEKADRETRHRAILTDGRLSS